MSATENSKKAQPEVFFLNDPVVRGRLYQLVVSGLMVALIFWLINNTAVNLAAQNKSMGFDFLWQTSGFEISFSLFEYDRTSTYFMAFLVGLSNTMLVAVIGIFIATIIGFTMGVARLSSNWLIARLATVYIEVIRNIPLLLQLFFWYFAVLKALPQIRDSFGWAFFTAEPVIFLNQRGLYLPKPIVDESFVWVFMALCAGIVGAIFLAGWAQRRLELTGKRFPVFWASLGLIAGLVAIVWFASGSNVTFEFAERQRFNFRGGLEIPPEFTALLFGLSLYTASFIAETVRAGILAVNKGQTEAAQSLGLKDGDRLNLVVIPQALRVIIPPLTSQYLNLTKNSSLGAAIAYPELVNVFAGTSLNQSGRAVEVIAITMAVYLSLSLITSGIMNWYNARVALVER